MDVYTPGLFGAPHPAPYDTMPIARYRLSGPRHTNGLPESPYL